jgi:hypothetical protein
VRADLLHAAFGARPDAAVRVPVDAAPLDRWLAAVVLGGQGRYAAAAALLTGLLGARDPVVAALAGTTLAAHLRQVGGHAEARGYDAEAARRLAGAPGEPGPAHPHGVDRAGATADVLLGLAADAVGLGRTGETTRLLAAARRVGGTPSWRTTVRIGWVAAELALATDRPDTAVSHAEESKRFAEGAGATRHTVKSTMMLAVALATGGTPDGRRRAERLLTDAVAVSLTRGMFSLTWPCALQLAELAPDQAAQHRAVAVDALTRVFSWSDPTKRRIAAASPWLPATLIHSGEPTRSGCGGIT